MAKPPSPSLVPESLQASSLSAAFKAIDQLALTHQLDASQWVLLFKTYLNASPEQQARLQAHAQAPAQALRDQHFGRRVFIRGLVEYSSYCENDCYYCGLRRSNRRAERYRLRLDQVLEACETAVSLGIYTFVLQGGENTIDDLEMPRIVRHLRQTYPDRAITLSLGEKPEAVYRALREAGADRYLLRHETAHSQHYRHLHPKPLTLEHRLACLYTLKRLGFQTGCGFMVGSPGQTAETLAEDYLLASALKPQMCGIGPFIPMEGTPFAKQRPGSVALTLFCLSLMRLLLPQVLLPSTTALATLDPKGRIAGLEAGGNVLMPNMTPLKERLQYLLYNGKANRGLEASEGYYRLCEQLAEAQYQVVSSRGDHPAYPLSPIAST